MEADVVGGPARHRLAGRATPGGPGSVTRPGRVLRRSDKVNHTPTIVRESDGAGCTVASQVRGGRPRSPARNLPGTGFFEGLELKKAVAPVALPSAGRLASDKYRTFPAAGDNLSAWLTADGIQVGGPDAFSREIRAELDLLARAKWSLTAIRLTAPVPQADRFTATIGPVALRFAAHSPRLPLRWTALSTGESVGFRCWVQAPFKADLPGGLSWMYQYLPMLARSERNIGANLLSLRSGWCAGKNLAGGASDFVAATGGDNEAHRMMREAYEKHGYEFNVNDYANQPCPGAKGQRAAWMEWAKQLTAQDAKAFPTLSGRLTAGRFLTRFEKPLSRAEMGSVPELVRASADGAEDRSEYTEELPTIDY